MNATSRPNPLQSSGRIALLVVWTFVVLTMSPFILAATHTWFWGHEHNRAPGAALLIASLLIALLLRRRWAWMILIAFNGVVVISYLWEWSSLPAFIMEIVCLALLVSPPMRYYVRRL